MPWTIWINLKSMFSIIPFILVFHVILPFKEPPQIFSLLQEVESTGKKKKKKNTGKS